GEDDRDPARRSGEPPPCRLDRARAEKRGVERHHPGEVGLPVLASAARQRPRGIAAREGHLEQPLGADEREKAEIERAGAHHRSSTSSEQKPGPMAMSKPRSPRLASREL